MIQESENAFFHYMLLKLSKVSETKVSPVSLAANRGIN